VSTAKRTLLLSALVWRSWRPVQYVFLFVAVLLSKPNHPRYLNAEFVGHTFPTKTTDDDERQREHTLRRARIHNQLASDPQYAGGLGWCAFDYNRSTTTG
jgi:hypothetical protein